ncbi:MAG: hypothetical protein AAGK32_05045 [Actinomycetota bacterium]
MRRWWWVAGGVAIVVLVAGVVLLVVLDIDQPGPASVDDAVERFEPGSDGGQGAHPIRPPEGVYEYAGDGVENLSFPPLSQRDGAVVPGTVTHLDDGCFRFRLDYNAAHWQDWRYCPVDGRMADTGGTTHQAWDLGVTTIENRSTFECDPPGPILPPEGPAWSVEHTCTGTNDQVDGLTTSDGPWRYVGTDIVTVGGTEVDALRFRGERTIGGVQDGRQVNEAWFRDDGLLLRADRELEVVSPSPVGEVTYTEEGRVVLGDLEPRR